MKRKISFFEIKEWEKEIIKGKLKKERLKFFNFPLNKNNFRYAKDSEIISVFIESKLDKNLIDKIPNLKLITTRSTGFDHIDVEYCKKRRISVCNVPFYGENTVAEHAFALILTLSRKIYPCIERTHEEHSFETDDSLTGFDLKDKNIGVIGYGNIGKHVVNIALGFGMKILVFERNPDEKLAKKIGFENVSFDELLKKSDIITIHVPYNKNTHHLIDKKAISKMKNGVYIINTSRGGIIHTHDLIEGLKSKKISGAGLDVLEEEHELIKDLEVFEDKTKSKEEIKTLLENHLLMKMNNVILTPHNAFNSKEALERILSTTIKNISDFILGRKNNLVF